MPSPQTDLLQGTLDLLILKSLALEESSTEWESRAALCEITSGTFEVRARYLFPALHRMEEAGWLISFWGESETNRRAKFYRLTKTGRKQFQAESERWEKTLTRDNERAARDVGGSS